MVTKEQVYEKAHLNESSELARCYFKELGLQLENFYPKSYYEKLSEMIQEEMYPLLADKTYQMVRNLRMHSKIKYDKDDVYLLTDGSYFSKREAITFDLYKRFIGFCGWASGCNRIPYIKGFIKWCDWIKELQKEKP